MTASSVSDVMSTINVTLRSAGASYAEYECKTVSWDDVTRGTVGGALSCWGSNITDTRLFAKSGQQLYTVRSQNFNEKLGSVSADELALIQGNQVAGGGPLTPITLRDFLRNIGSHGAYAGLDKNCDLSDAAADSKVSIRFMTTFLPVADESRSSMEFAPEMYQYQTRSETDPANLLLLATTQGVAVQANGPGATKLFHHAVEPSDKIARYWFEAERSDKQVGGAQKETAEEALEAAKRGKATAAVIGTRAMGTRFNVLMTIQVPLQQQPSKLRGGFMGAMSCSNTLAMGGLPCPAPVCYAGMDVDDNDLLAELEGMEEEAESGFGAVSVFEAASELPCSSVAAKGPKSKSWKPQLMARGASRGRSAAPRVGRANAARVSRGSMVDRVDATIKVKTPKRDPSQHVTVTVVLYNTVAGGVPSVEDVKAAVEDMEQLYASCGWTGSLQSSGADFMKAELTVKDTIDIAHKLKTQPYVPPAGELGLVQGGDVFPSSSA